MNPNLKTLSAVFGFRFLLTLQLIFASNMSIAGKSLSECQATHKNESGNWESLNKNLFDYVFVISEDRTLLEERIYKAGTKDLFAVIPFKVVYDHGTRVPNGYINSQNGGIMSFVVDKDGNFVAIFEQPKRFNAPGMDVVSMRGNCKSCQSPKRDQ